MGDIDKTVEGITTITEKFFNNIQSGSSVADQVSGMVGQVSGVVGQVSGVVGQVSGIVGGLGGIKIPSINGNIVEALSFENITLNLFGCDFKPNCAASDFYTLQEGGGAAEKEPNKDNVAKASDNPLLTSPTTNKLDFDNPTEDTR
jgi:hypothetical protein